MCYTGKCPYEDRDGECVLEFDEETPEDAHCTYLESEVFNEQNPSD